MNFESPVVETAAEHVSTLIPVAAPDATAGEVRRSLLGKRFECATDVAICEDGKLRGLLRIEDLLAAPDAAVLKNLMDADPPVVASGVDQEAAAWKAVQHGESSIAVADEGGRFLGLVSPRRMLTVLLQEHEEDLARAAGFLKGVSMARSSTDEPLHRRLRHRLPWLLVGLAGAVAVAGLVGSFEGKLADNLLLAFFIPGIVYLADAVGTQTETLVIRGLSVGIPIGRIVVRELLTGAVVGALLALLSFPIVSWGWGRDDVALAVALALACACSVATVVAMALPWILDRLGTDPAFGSGPLATVIQDLLTIVIYFVIAMNLVK